MDNELEEIIRILKIVEYKLQKIKKEQAECKSDCPLEELQYLRDITEKEITSQFEKT